MPVKHNHRYHVKKRKHPYKHILKQTNKNILKQVNNDSIEDDIKRGHYMGYWRKQQVRIEAKRMNEIRNKMRAEIGLPPL